MVKSYSAFFSHFAIDDLVAHFFHGLNRVWKKLVENFEIFWYLWRHNSWYNDVTVTKFCREVLYIRCHLGAKLQTYRLSCSEVMGEKPRFWPFFGPKKRFLPLKFAKIRKSKIGLRLDLAPKVLQNKNPSGPSGRLPVFPKRTVHERISASTILLYI